ncbi:MAG: hypothetical protein A2Y61_05595 [Chloroflexi bacterium RBG_13_60_13]|nr:MAG: hypothetical protein A2Y61_05595 [Chloroflexi bacterium RBG_13_60_13]
MVLSFVLPVGGGENDGWPGAAGRDRSRTSRRKRARGRTRRTRRRNSGGEPTSASQSDGPEEQTRDTSE